MESNTQTTSASAEKPKIVLYWLEESRSQRILWLLEELNLPYELKIFHRDPKTHLAPPELKEIHPLGKSPVISITPPGATTPTIVAESALITEYLSEHFGSESDVLPKHWQDGKEGQVCGETEEWQRYKYFLHYAEGTLMTFMILSLVANTIKGSSVPFFVRPITNAISAKLFSGFITPNINSNFSFLESTLKKSGGTYLCGTKLTSADILLSFPLIAAKGGRAGALDKATYPLLVEYIDRLENEPGYKKSVEKIISIEGKFTASM